MSSQVALSDKIFHLGCLHTMAYGSVPTLKPLQTECRPQIGSAYAMKMSKAPVLRTIETFDIERLSRQQGNA
jgi:hypothetical protein